MSGTLEAGRELDALVAEKVMGFGFDVVSGPTWSERRTYDSYDRLLVCTSADGRTVYSNDLLRYSMDVAAAFLVVDRWRKRGDGFQLDSLGFRGEEWRCGFMDASNGGMEIHFAEAATAPLAICKAALAAVSVSPSENRNDEGTTKNDQLKNHRRQDATT